MKISLHDFRNVDDYSRQVEVRETWPALHFQGQEIKFPQDVTIRFQLERRGDSLQLTGTVNTVLRMACGRCTEEFDLPVKVAVSERIPLQQDDDPDEQWGSSYLDRETDTLDLSECALLAIVEQIPLQPLCRVDCRGLCPTCGQNLNQGECDCSRVTVDPRLAVLSQLLKKDPR